MPKDKCPGHHDWIAYTDHQNRGTRWHCKACGEDIGNFEWFDRYAVKGPALRNEHA